MADQRPLSGGVLRHRPEIDGLRAFAVIPVILNHAGFGLFRGGYSGVDVFFVISGFLITGILKQDIDKQQFSLITFYERRARRILPALFVVLLASLLVGWYVLLPGDFRNFGQSIVAVDVFLSNVFFLRENGYFDPSNLYKPLLHTWSLAVEEQFYVLFPLLLFGLCKFFKAHVFRVTLGLAVLSLVWCEIFRQHNADANFYLLPGRGWELLAGSLLALSTFDREAEAAIRPRLFQTASLLGLVLILLPIFVFTDQTPWPSYLTLMPVIGAVLIIACATPGTLAYKILANPLAVGIGLISYSAYLWHQPIFVFARKLVVTPIPDAGYLALIALSLGVAYLSWRFIEQPFRDRKRLGRGIIFAGAGGLTAAFLLLGLGVHLAGGVPGRFTGETHAIAQGSGDISPYRDRCTNQLPASLDGFCVFGNPHAPIVAVAGDSHSTELFWQMSEHIAGRAYAIQEMTHNRCLPFASITYATPTEPCRVFHEQMKAYILATPQVGTIVMPAAWEGYFDHPGEPPYVTAVGHADLVTGRREAERLAAITTAMDHEIDEYLAAGKKVLLVYPDPEPGVDVPQLMLADVRASQGFSNVAISQAHYMAEDSKARDFISREAKKPGVSTFDPSTILCADGNCPSQHQGQPLYFDHGHLNGAGEALLAVPLLDQIGAMQPSAAGHP